MKISESTLLPDSGVPLSLATAQGAKRLRTKILLSFALVGCILLGMAAFEYRSSSRLIRNADEVAHTYDVLDALNHTLADLIDVETGQRGYVITGREEYLEPLYRGKREVQLHLKRLGKVIANNGEQQKRLQRLIKQAGERIEYAEGVVRTREIEGFAAARTVVAVGTGKRQMDEVRRLLQTMRNTEIARLQQHTREAQVAAQQTRIAGWLGLFMNMALLAYVFTQVQRESRRSYEAENQLQQANNSLQNGNIELQKEIAEREHVQAALYEIEERFRIAAESSLDAFYMLKNVHNDTGEIADFRIVFANKRGCEILDRTRDEVEGQLISELIPLHFANGYFENHKRVAQTKVPFEEETYFNEARVKVQWLRHLIVPMQDGVAVTVSDITAQKKTEEQLRRYTEQLEASNRELQDFAYVASHDLQEPLRKIQTFGDRLQSKCKDSLSEDGLDYLKRMQGAAERMQTLISDLLEFSRVTTMARPFAPVDLNQVAAEVIGDLEVRIEQTGGHVEIGKLPTIEADAVQMRQLLQNLIGNALKFHRPDAPPMVQIRAQITVLDSANESGALPQGAENGFQGLSQVTVPDYLQVSPSSNYWYQLFIKDNGIGFEEKYAERIFVPFQRLHGREAYAGTGIGLAVCRKIVERHGGSIKTHSTLGQGSTFVVTLPVRRENSGGTPGDDPTAFVPQSTTKPQRQACMSLQDAAGRV